MHKPPPSEDQRQDLQRDPQQNASEQTQQEAGEARADHLFASHAVGTRMPRLAYSASATSR